MIINLHGQHSISIGISCIWLYDRLVVMEIFFFSNVFLNEKPTVLERNFILIFLQQLEESY